jgi:hypothetical protein
LKNHRADSAKNTIEFLPIGAIFLYSKVQKVSLQENEIITLAYKKKRK